MSATVNNSFLVFPKAIACEGIGVPSALYVLVVGASLLMVLPASLANIVFNVGDISVSLVVAAAVDAVVGGVVVGVVVGGVVDAVGGVVDAVSIPST